MHGLAHSLLDFFVATSPSPSIPNIPSNPTSTTPSKDDTAAIKVALIGSIGLILSVAVPTFAATFNKSRAVPEETETKSEKELRRRAEVAERIATRHEKEIDRLERLLWKHQIDPEGGRG